ncbi:MAG: 3-hydroxyacyl-ACP dehydratase [Saprospiraceae bacterium]|nr:3-hydroxyacyl-ACP dehydratase [Candidatus Brachybacter algidus]
MGDINTFFSIHTIEREGDLLPGFKIRLDADHPIFKGHFPGQPVLPGVMILKIITSCVSLYQKRNLLISKVKQCKFLNFVDPIINPELFLDIEIYGTDSPLDVKAVLRSEEVVFSKVSISLTEQLKA